MYTEEEATEKWCPMFRAQVSVGATGNDAQWAFNREAGEMGRLIRLLEVYKSIYQDMERNLKPPPGSFPERRACDFVPSAPTQPDAPLPGGK